MSHASVIVAIDGQVPRIQVEDALREDMAPFDENQGDMFADGTRWDWYQIGGRFTGMLSAYNPEDDRENYSVCGYCNGTGTREDATHRGPSWLRGHGNDLYPVIGQGCNVCFGTGYAFAWPTGYKPHDGDVMRRGEIDLAQFRIRSATQAAAAFQQFERDRAETTTKDDPSAKNYMAYLWGEHWATVDRAAFIAQRTLDFPAAYAFLRDGHWHEKERMGWFGGTASTECEVKAKETGAEPPEGTCIYRRPDGRGAIFSWAGREDWAKAYYRRFILNLHPETWLVLVDFHV